MPTAVPGSTSVGSVTATKTDTGWDITLPNGQTTSYQDSDHGGAVSSVRVEYNADGDAIIHLSGPGGAATQTVTTDPVSGATTIKGTDLSGNNYNCTRSKDGTTDIDTDTPGGRVSTHISADGSMITFYPDGRTVTISGNMTNEVNGNIQTITNVNADGSRLVITKTDNADGTTTVKSELFNPDGTVNQSETHTEGQPGTNPGSGTTDSQSDDSGGFGGSEGGAEGAGAGGGGGSEG